MSCKDQTKGQATESLEQFRVYDDLNPTTTSANLRYVKFAVVIRIHKVNCVVIRLRFSLKRFWFLTPAWLRENKAIFTANARKSRELITCSIS